MKTPSKYDFFEFSNYAEIAWLNFYSLFEEKIKPEKESNLIHSQRSKVLIDEAKRQKLEHRMGYNIEPKTGPLYFNWKPAIFSQKVCMYDTNEQDISTFAIEFSIEIPFKDKLKKIEIKKILSEMGENYIYKGSVKSIISDLVFDLSIGRAGFSYIIDKDSVKLINRHVVSKYDEKYIYSFIIPIIIRQNAYAYFIYKMLFYFNCFNYKNIKDINEFESNIKLESFEPFVSNLISSKYNEYIKKSITDEETVIISPEGVFENVLLHGNKVENLFEKIVINLNKIIESLNLNLMKLTGNNTNSHVRHYCTQDGKDFYSFSYQNSNYELDGSVSNKELAATLDPTLCIDIYKTYEVGDDEITIQNILNSKDENIKTQNLSVYKNEIIEGYKNYCINNKNVMFNSNVDIGEINEKNVVIVYKLSIALGQLGLVDPKNIDEASQIISIYLSDFIVHINNYN